MYYMPKEHKGSSILQLGKGLDVGTAFIYVAWQEGGEITFRIERDAFFDIPYSDHLRALFDREDVQYTVREDALYVIGGGSLRLANLLNRAVRRPLARGVISPKEKEALPFITMILKNALGEHRHKGEIVYYSTPASPIDADFDVEYHERIVNGILSQSGYTPRSINEGLAVIFSELPKNNFTGLAFSFGAGMINVCLANLSVPIATFSIARGGDWIDARVAEVTNEPISKVTAWKEDSLDLTKKTHDSRIEQAASIYYDILLDYVVHQLKTRLKAATVYIEEPVAIIVSGGTATPPGFLERFEQRMRTVKLPIALGEMRLAKEPLHTVAKGALIAAIADEHHK